MGQKSDAQVEITKGWREVLRNSPRLPKVLSAFAPVAPNQGISVQDSRTQLTQRVQHDGVLLWAGLASGLCTPRFAHSWLKAAFTESPSQ